MGDARAGADPAAEADLQATRFLLNQDEAAWIVDNMEARIRSTWYETVRSCGVSDIDRSQIAGGFACPGFRT